MKLIIVRHGETFENLNKITQGHLNSQLTQTGIDQAKKVSQRLKDYKIDIAISSDLDRALNTCKEILKFHKDTQLITTLVLREQKKGIFEGKHTENRDKLLVEKNIKFHEWMPEGGERLIDVWNKIIPFIDELKEKYFDKNVLIVSHGGPISCILTYMHNKDISQTKYFHPKNTAISIVNIDKENKLEFEILNCAKHLD